MADERHYRTLTPTERQRKRLRERGEPVQCGFVGCEELVPVSEWPSDADDPIICDAHLRATQTRPGFRRIPDPAELDNDMTQVMSE